MLVVLGLFALYVVWMALSVTWAMGPGPAWHEAARTGFYLVFFALALTYLGRPGAQTAERFLLLAAGLVIVAMALWAFVFPTEADFFLARRLGFPIAYPNGTGSFYLLLVWPLLWLAADPRGRLWMRALSLGTITALVQLGILTQSRGAAAALVLSALLYFLLTPARLRSLVFLILPALLVALSFEPLTAYYSEGANQVDRSVALLWIASSWLVAAVAGVVLSLVDRRLRLTPRVRLGVSAVVVVVLLAGAGLGFVQFQNRVGDVSAWASDALSTFIDDEGGAEGAGIGDSRFGDLRGNGRGPMWRTAWEGFLDSPIIGNGAASYRYLNELHRPSPTMTGQQAHSIELDVLDETGVVGMILFVGAFGSALGLALAPRFRSWWALFRRRRPFFLTANAPQFVPGARPASGFGDQAWIAALTGAVLFWFIHASVDWIWHLPGVTLGALLLLAYALATSVVRPEAVIDEQAPPAASSPAPRRDSWSATFRIALAVVSFGVVVAVGLPYLSYQYENVALSRMRTDTETALGHASTARYLFPVSAEPFLIRANVYRAAAQAATDIQDPGARSTAVREALALAVAANERAIEKERASSQVHQEAGMATLDLLAARNAGSVYGDRAESWAGLGAATETRAGSESPALLLATDDERRRVQEILALTDQELLRRAREHLEAARERDPLDGQLAKILPAIEAAP